MINIMNKYTVINLKLQGFSNRQIANNLKLDRKTIGKYWNEYQRDQELLLAGPIDSQTKEELQSRLVSAPKYDVSNRKPRKLTIQIKNFIDDIIESEMEKNKLFGPSHKQSLNAKQIHEILVELVMILGIVQWLITLKSKKRN